MALVTGKIGLEDLALGEGTEIQQLGTNITRTITKINAGNLPFDSTRLLIEVLTEFDTLIASSAFSNVQSNLGQIVDVDNNEAAIQSVSTNMTHIQNISSQMAQLQVIIDNIDVVLDSANAAASTNRDVLDIKYARCDLNNAYEKSNRYAAYIRDAYDTKLQPLEVKVDALLVILNDLVDNAVNTINIGHDMAVKLGTYELVILPKPLCRNPQVLIDDTAQTITWIVPTVKGDCAVLQSQVETQIVQATTDAYLATLALGGGGVTTADVNALISAYHLANPIVDTEYRIIEEALNWKVVSSEGGAVPNYDKITYPLATDAFMQYMITEQGFVAGTDATQFRATAFETLKVNYIFGLADGSLIEYTLYTHTDSTNDAILSEKLVENIVGTEIIDSNTIALVNTGRGILVKAPNTAVITAHSSEYTVTVDNLSFFTGMGLISVTLAVDPTGMSSADDGEHYITLNVDGIEVYVGVDIFYDPATSTVTISGQNRLRYDLTRATTWRSSPTMGAKPTVEVGASNIPDTVEIIEGTGLSFDAITLNGTAGGGTLPNYNVTFNIEAGFVVDSLFKVRIGDDTNGYITVLMRPTAVGPFYLTEGIDYITTKGEVQ